MYGAKVVWYYGMLLAVGVGVWVLVLYDHGFKTFQGGLRQALERLGVASRLHCRLLKQMPKLRLPESWHAASSRTRNSVIAVVIGQVCAGKTAQLSGSSLAA